MIRVIYEWPVNAAAISTFHDAWKHTTTMIHKSVKGTRGRFLVHEVGHPGKILTVARWDSLEEWPAFWKSENPQEMRKMQDLGKHISVTAYDELADCTV